MGLDLDAKSEFVAQLKAEARNYGCGEYLAALEPLKRYELLQKLEYERLERKCSEAMELYREADENWNQTFYLMLFFKINPSDKLKQQYLELARRVTYKMILRERTVFAAEAMLLGASGLLDRYPNDEYLMNLKREFVHLSAKYGIKPMDSSCWYIRGSMPASHPVHRIVQLAALLTQNELLFDKILGCECETDVHSIFCVEASSYWSTHDVPARSSEFRVKRIGRDKANIIGINLVSIMQYLYGSYVGSDTLMERAVDLLERLPYEDNMYTSKWAMWGVPKRCAYDSQALIQLSTLYCSKRLCEECPVGIRRVNSAL